MSLLFVLYHCLFFFVLVFGLGLPWISGLRFSPLESLALGASAGVFTIYLFAGAAYWAELPLGIFNVLPVLAALLILMRWQTLSALFRQPEARRVVGLQLLFSGWCVGWVALVHSYSGGEWAGDWYEHYERSRFFLDHGPLSTRFISIYLLPARPPLGNLVDAALMTFTGGQYPAYQLANTLFSTLLLLPAIMLVRYFQPRGRRGDIMLLCMMMGSPLILQNATFGWTKLLTAHFVLLAIALYLSGFHETSQWRRTLAFAAIAAAFLVHYSAGPYLVALTAAELWRSWTVRRTVAPWRPLGLAALSGAAVLLTWFSWSVLHFGFQTTFLSNSTAIGDAQISPASWVSMRAWNTFITLVPHPLRPVDYRFIGQSSALGFVRDYWFNIFQTTLPGAFGFAGLFLFIAVARQARSPRLAPPERHFLQGLTVIVLVLGIASVAWNDRWGVVQICLIPLVVLGISWLAARSTNLSDWSRRLWLIALTLDFALGIALHFYLQHRVDLAALHALQQPGAVNEYSVGVLRNLLLKAMTRVSYVGDTELFPWACGGIALCGGWAGHLLYRDCFSGRAPAEGPTTKQ